MTVHTETTDAAGSISTIYDLDVGDMFEGHNARWDNDWVSVVLEAGVSYRLYFDYSGNDGYWTELRLYDETGTRITGASPYPDWNGHDQAILYTPSEANLFYVGTYNTNDKVFDYTITISQYEAPPPEPPPVWSINQFVEQLRKDYWNDVGDRAPRRFKVDKNDKISVDISGLTDAGQKMARAALELWSGVSGLKFKEVTSGADIEIDDEEAGSATTFELRTKKKFIKKATVNLDKNDLTASNYVETYAFQTFLHEIGHALGLGHAGSYNADATYAVDGTGDNTSLNDSWQTSVMSYFNQNENTTVVATLGYVITPMMADILAIQKIYANRTAKYKDGNTVYDLDGINTPRMDFDVPSSSALPYAMTLFDTSGIDTFDASDTTENQKAVLKSGAKWDIDGGMGNVVVGPQTIIENFKGGEGEDQVTGNKKNNILIGNGGEDVLKGLGGRDNLNGGDEGDDLFGGSGLDTLRGGEGDDTLDGGKDADKLFGGEGEDTLIAGKGQNDKLRGDADADTFVFDKREDRNLIYDFEDGLDLLDLTAFGFASAFRAKKKFNELGRKNDDKVMFDHAGTKIVIKGIDLKDVSGADMLI